MVACGITVILWTGYIRREFKNTSRVKWLFGRDILHAGACPLFVFLVVPLIAWFPPYAMIPALVFLFLAGRRVSNRGRRNRNIAGVLSLCFFLWLAHWGYETQLYAWMKTVVGA